MAKFDVHMYRSGEGLLLDVQADLLDHLNTRVVVPLLPIEQAPKPASRLNPIFDIDGHQFVMVAQFLAAVPTHELGAKITNLNANLEEITNALDMAFQGF